MQICETMKKYQMVLIHEFLPDIFSVLSERDKKCKISKFCFLFMFFNIYLVSFLKGKPSNLIKKFFKRPIVVSLDNFISAKEFKVNGLHLILI